MLSHQRVNLMSWFGPGDHHIELAKEAATLRSKAAALEQAVQTKGGLIEEATLAERELSRSESELAEVHKRLNQLVQSNSALSTRAEELAEANAALTQEYELFDQERKQADRLSVEVASELATVEEKIRVAQHETTVLAQKELKYSQDLSKVDEVAESVEDIQEQIIFLREDLRLAQEEEEAVTAQIEDAATSCAEEEMIHEALIANLATCQEELRSLRQRSSLADRSKMIRQFFTEANSLAKRCIAAAAASSNTHQQQRRPTGGDHGGSETPAPATTRHMDPSSNARSDGDRSASPATSDYSPHGAYSGTTALNQREERRQMREEQKSREQEYEDLTPEDLVNLEARSRVIENIEQQLQMFDREQERMLHE